MAFVVICRDIWRVSLTFARCWSNSREESVRCESDMSGSVDACGSSSRVDSMSGINASMVSGSGMMGRGPEKDAAKDVSVRDW